MLKRIFGLLFAIQILGGCSAYMAATADNPRDLDILKPGTSRAAVLAEFGTPIVVVNEPGERYDVFKFVQGRSDGSNAARAFLYGTAAVFTLGVSEAVMTPLEAAAGDQGEIKLKVTYSGDALLKAELLNGSTWVSITEHQSEIADGGERWANDPPPTPQHAQSEAKALASPRDSSHRLPEGPLYGAPTEAAMYAGAPSSPVAQPALTAPADVRANRLPAYQPFPPSADQAYQAQATPISAAPVITPQASVLPASVPAPPYVAPASAPPASAPQAPAPHHPTAYLTGHPTTQVAAHQVPGYDAQMAEMKAKWSQIIAEEQQKCFQEGIPCDAVMDFIVAARDQEMAELRESLITASN